jgi:S-(hydroxymethyl)glutathione dehydrogenase/alcohol dehydrogenase
MATAHPKKGLGDINMKAAVLTKLNSPLEIVELNIPDLQFGQVLVDVKRAGICGAQLLEISGYKGNEKFLPHLMGHEGGGVVVDVGEGVTKVRAGDRVVMHWRKGYGIEAPFTTYVSHGLPYGKVGSGKVTTFAEQSVVSENRITKIADDAPFELCSLLGCAITTAFGCVNNDANLKLGESVLVLGCGGIGLSLIKASSISGASRVIGYDIHDKKKMSLKHGARDFAQEWGLLSEKFDVIFDTVGNPDLFSSAVSILNSGGRYVMIGQPKPGTKLCINNGINMFDGDGKTITASQGGGTNPDVDIDRYYQMHKNEVFNFEDLITHTFKLREINEAIQTLQSGVAGRILIDTE